MLMRLFPRCLSRATAAVLLLLASLPARAAAPVFSDVPPSNPAYAAVQDLAGRGIVQGVAPGVFAPAQPLTRAQFAALLVRAEGWAGTPGPSFADVAPSDWFAGAVEAVAGQDVIEGTGPTTFAPNAPLTRAMVAALLPRAIGLRHVADDEAGTALPFSDAAAVPGWARGGVAVTTHLGLMPSAGGAFGPGAIVTRADAAMVVDRLLHLSPAAIGAEADRVVSAVHVVPDAADLVPG